MWCAECRTDVAAELSLDNNSFRCTTCRSELGIIAPSSAESSENTRALESAKGARELLARWNAETTLASSAPSLLPPKFRPAAPTVDLPNRSKLTKVKANDAGYGNAQVDRFLSPGNDSSDAVPLSGADALLMPFLAEGTDAPHTPGASQSAKYPSRPESTADNVLPLASQPQFRVDGPSPTAGQTKLSSAALAGGQTAASAETRKKVTPPSRKLIYRNDLGQPLWRSREPHFDLRTASKGRPPADRPLTERRRFSWTGLFGQLAAYVGVLTLTAGTGLILWSYLGGPPRFGPMGWLVTTAGQMVLFLGVVALISGGMSQTTDEVARHMETLGERLIRIETAQSDRGLRGPHRRRARTAGRRSAGANSISADR